LSAAFEQLSGCLDELGIRGGDHREDLALEAGPVDRLPLWHPAWRRRTRGRGGGRGGKPRRPDPARPRLPGRGDPRSGDDALSAVCVRPRPAQGQAAEAAGPATATAPSRGAVAPRPRDAGACGPPTDRRRAQPLRPTRCRSRPRWPPNLVAGADTSALGREPLPSELSGSRGHLCARAGLTSRSGVGVGRCRVGSGP